MNLKIAILTNKYQKFGAKVSKYSFILNSFFDSSNIDILSVEENFTILKHYFGKSYIRNGKTIKFKEDDLQSFTLTRFFIPEYFNYSGYVLAIDPDIFCVRDINKFLTEFFENSSDNFDIAARPSSKNDGDWESSCMILNCKNLKRFSSDKILTSLFDTQEEDYSNLMRLNLPNLRIKPLPEIMNSFDKFRSDTLLLHNTNRLTQPWKEGLKTNFEYYNLSLKGKIKVIVKKILKINKFEKHPDRNQVDIFFYLAYKAFMAKHISSKEILKEIENKNIRNDLLKYLNDHYFKAPTLREKLSFYKWKFNNHKLNNAKPDTKFLFDKMDLLKKNGCVKIDGKKFFTSLELEKLKLLKDYAANKKDKFLASDEIDHNKNIKSYRIDIGGYLNFHKKLVDINFNDFFINNILQLALKNEFINIANDYLGVTPYLSRFYLWYDYHNEDNNNPEGTQYWHRDSDDKKFIKFFIYLNDVNSNNGPFTYLNKTNFYGKNKNLNLIGKPVKYQSFLGVDDSNNFLSSNKEDIIENLGSFSDLIIADTSGYHKGKFISKGLERYMIVFEYTSRLSSKAPVYTFQNLNNSSLSKKQISYLN